MTRDKKRKAEVRTAQQGTGRRYAQVAREMKAVATLPARAFPLAQLLTECATLPSADVDWGYDPELAPPVFLSRALGGVVPYGTVLELAGALAQEGRSALLVLEALHPLEAAIVVCNGRRFELLISQDRATELCRTSGCGASPSTWAFSRCDSHLADCDAAALEAMASNWGHARREELNRDPLRLGGSPHADLLIKAAAANGAVDQVSKAFLHMCFEDPDMIDEIYWNEADALAMKYGLERERLRLYEVARAEAMRIRTKAAACPTCMKPFTSLRSWDPTIPPQYCAKDCAPPAASVAQVPSAV